VICVYLFDPIVNGANESSPACEPGIELHVETNTPPVDSTIAKRMAIASDAGFRRRLVRIAFNIPELLDGSSAAHWKNLMTNGYS
jgi:hypothetical protein